MKRPELLTEFDSRAEFDESVTAQQLEELAEVQTVEVLQFSSPVSLKKLRLINDQFLAKRPDVMLRAYGSMFGPCDLRFVSELSNVRHFAADCLREATHVERVNELSQLETLSLGIFEQRDFRFLEQLPLRLTSLSLNQTRSKRLDLKPLQRLKHLETLSLDGHHKGIEAIQSLAMLKELTLRGISTPDLSFLSPLKKLWSLRVVLGGIKSFAGIGAIKRLSIIQVREMFDVEILADLAELQNLHLQSLPHIRSAPSLHQAKKLRRVTLENLKSFDDFSNLGNAPAIEEFALIDGKHQTSAQLLPLLKAPSLKRISAYFGSHQKNREFAQLRDAHGLADGASSMPFVYS